MQAAVLKQFRSPLVFEEVAAPTPGPGQVLIRVEACGVCHSDVHLADGDWPQLRALTKLPLVLGHEVAGRVTAAGVGVEAPQTGTRVGLPWLHWSCGTCEYCTAGRETLCLQQKITGVTVDGGFAEYVLAYASHVVPLPEGLSSEEAAPLLCAGLTAYKALKSAAAVSGQVLAVFGVGGLGHFALQLGRTMGLRMWAVDVADEKLELARECGAEWTVNTRETPAHKAIRTLGGAHLALVTTASLEAYESALRSLRRGGTLLVVGMPPEPIPVSAVTVIGSELKLIGSAVGTREDLRELVEIAASGAVRSHYSVRPLAEVETVFGELRAGTLKGRAVLRPPRVYNRHVKPSSLLFLAGLLCLLTACGAGGPNIRREVQDFLRLYDQVENRLYTIAAEASWKAATDVSDLHTGERIGADAAHAAFRGSPYVIESCRKFLEERQSLGDLEFRQLDKILLNAAESPGTIPEVVQARVRAEAKLGATLDGFTFCLERRGEQCAKKTDPNEIDEVLLKSRNLGERRKYWEVSKQTGPALKSGLAELRDLRNRVARELGYSSYFHLQVADYGMTVQEMNQLMEKTVADVQPLYRRLHEHARRLLAARYKKPVPQKLPAHWLPNRWGQQWPGLVEAIDLDPYFRGKTPKWIVEQAERFYVSLGMPSLPKSFWEKSDLYQLPRDSMRKKNTHASAWHIDRAQDVRSLMSVIPNYQWFETSHHELDHVYYYIAYTNPKVPLTLREGLNRAFHEAVGDLIGMGARQEPYLKEIGVLPKTFQADPMQVLLGEALDHSIVFLPWSAGVMTHFEHDLYEKNLPADQFNKRWWELADQYQQIEPPAPRGEEFCDGCTKTHVIDDAAQYYDYAMATLVRYQLHDYIARKILRQDPHHCNYYGNKEVGKWLQDILSLGAARDWRQVIREKTGEDLSSRALVEYFRPLNEYLDKTGSQAAQ